jgi:hypothetical protein
VTAHTMTTALDQLWPHLDPALRSAADAVTGRLQDPDELNALTPHLLEAPAMTDPTLLARLALWCAEAVRDQVQPHDRAAYELALTTARSCLADPTLEHALLAGCAARAALGDRPHSATEHAAAAAAWAAEAAACLGPTATAPTTTAAAAAHHAAHAAPAPATWLGQLLHTHTQLAWTGTLPPAPR